MGKKTKYMFEKEAQICLNCPFSTCVEEKGKQSTPCEYFNAELKKIEEDRKGKQKCRR